MLLDIIVRDCGGKVVEMTGAWVSGLDRADVPLFSVAPGYEIQADVKDDKGRHLGTYFAFHAYVPTRVTATKSDGGVAVTDDASNTYIRE